MSLATPLFRAGLFLCVLIFSQLPVHAQATTKPEDWSPAERAMSDSIDSELDAIAMRYGLREGTTATLIASDTTVYTVEAVDQLPIQPGGGGAQAIAQAILKAFRYPTLALRKGRQGTAIVSFVVDENGEITNAKVTKGLGYGIDEELLKAVHMLPKFLPAKCSGQYVRVGLVLPIVLSMN